MKMLKDPQALQLQAQEAQARVASVNVVGSAGGGMVRVTLNGVMEMLSVEIAPEVVDPAEIGLLQDLVRAAYNDASERVKEATQAEIARSMGGMGLPDMGGLFGGQK
ncbi:MAG: YbaB/EbfC family nucleoid-associated protein [Spirochaetales bacterium]|nr:MAG: YbaB/EbfC family nucleoid-associated protein [Spirochaetales bacterium]